MNYIDLLRQSIPQGKENAKHLDELAEIINDTPSRTKKLIQSARREGECICSGQRGYWYSESEDEMKVYCYMLVKQAISRLLTVKPIRRTLKEIKGQINLSDIINDFLDNGGGGIE